MRRSGAYAVPGTIGRRRFLPSIPDAGVLVRLPFGKLRARVLQAAGAFLRAGVQPGDRVLLCLGDVPEFPVAYFGAIAAGGVATPLSSQLSEEELKAIIETVEPRVILGGPYATMPFDALEREVEGRFLPRHPDDPALLVFTSGSSGATERGFARATGILGAPEHAGGVARHRTGGPGDACGRI